MDDSQPLQLIHMLSRQSKLRDFRKDTTAPALFFLSIDRYFCFERPPECDGVNASDTNVILAVFVADPRQSGEGRALSRGGHWPRDRAPPAPTARVSALTGDDRSAGTTTLCPAEQKHK